MSAFRFAQVWFLILILALAGCGKRESEAFALEPSEKALFEVVLGKHAETREPVFLKLPDTVESGTSSVDDAAGYCLKPDQVIRLSAEQVVLLVSGLHCASDSEDWGPAVLGAYLFQQREAKWYRASQLPVFHKISDSNVELKVRVALGAELNIIGVEHGDCGGSCVPMDSSSWLHLFQVSEQGLLPLTELSKPIRLGYRQIGRSVDDECPQGFESAAPGSKLLDGEIGFYRGGCFLMDAAWKILPATQGFGDLIIDFSGRKTSEPVEIKASPDAVGSDESAPAQDAVSHPAQVTVESVKGQQIFRFRNGRYELLKGKNPAETMP